MIASSISRLFSRRAKPTAFNNRWSVVRGDLVAVLAGKDKGKTGEVTKVYRKEMMVRVEGVNVQNKRKRQSEDGETEHSNTVLFGKIHYSNVGLVDPETGRATRVGYGYLEDGRKVRVAKRSGAIIEKPVRDVLKYENRTKNVIEGPLDTLASTVLEVTYKGEDFDTISEEFSAFIKEKDRLEELLVFRK